MAQQWKWAKIVKTIMMIKNLKMEVKISQENYEKKWLLKSSLF